MPSDFDQNNARHRERRRSTSRGLNESLTTRRTLYELLGLSKKASDDDIKRAYRRMALKFHPDKNRNDPEASKKFQDINYSYAVLSNRTKRKIYDEYGEIGLKMTQRLGDEKMSIVLRPWAKCLICLLTLVTCGCFCCCCSCCGCFKCCCNFCFGACKPDGPNSDIVNPFEPFEDLEDQIQFEPNHGTVTSEATAQTMPTRRAALDQPIDAC